MHQAEIPNEAAASADFEFAALELAVNYRRAMVREFGRYLRGDVVEVGAGIGQLSSLIEALPAVRSLTAIEPGGELARRFRERASQLTLIEGTIDDLPPGRELDAIVNINVLEHIRDDDAELAKYQTLLARRAGHLCLFVPARGEIYAPIDKDFGHHRRYEAAGLRAQLERAGFEILRLHYFNVAGYFAWWLNFCVLQKRTFDPGAVKLYDRLVFPIVHAFERGVARPPIGQSLLAIARATSR